MKFGLQFREQYQKEAGGAIASEFDNMVAFLQNLWDKVLDSEGNLKVTLTDNSKGGAGTTPVYVNVGDEITDINNTIAAIPTSSGPLTFVAVPVTVAQLQSGSAIQVVSPVTGGTLIPIWFGYNERRGGTGFTSTPTFQLKYTAVAGNLLTVGMQAGANTNFWSLRYNTHDSATQHNTNTDNSGVGLEVTLSTALTGAGITTAEFIVGYYELPALVA